jgi:hypothetical protein
MQPLGEAVLRVKARVGLDRISSQSRFDPQNVGNQGFVIPVTAK